MRIGIDARILQGEKRGQGQYVHYLIKNLLEIDDLNEYVLFYNGFNKGKPAFSADIPHLRQVWSRVPGSMLWHSWERLNFPPAEAFIGDIDVFHNPVNFNFTQYTPVPSKADMVVTFNGMADPSTIWEKCDTKKIDNWFRKIADTASIIIAVSEMVKKDLQRRVPIPDEKIRIVHYGVSREFKPAEDRSVLRKVLSKYGLADKKYLLYVGAAEPNKNLETLLTVFSDLSKKAGLDDTHLVLAGKTDDFYRRLADKAAAFGIARKVIFTDYVNHEDLPYMYNGADAFVLPTLVEWFGIPVLEAMACGTPVAVSRNTGALDAVGDSAITFDPRDPAEMAGAIGAVLQKEDLRHALREKGMESVKKVSWKETARRTLDVYKEVGGKKKAYEG